MSERRTKRIRRVVLAVGIPAVAKRVWKRIRRDWRETPRPMRPRWRAGPALARASNAAFAAFWGRMTPVERAKFMKRVEKKQ